MRDDRPYLSHIEECIARVEGYAASGRASFMESALIQDAVMRNLQSLGESARRISGETRAGRPEVDWRGIIGFRNILVHDYLSITMVRVWEVVEGDLPILKNQVETMLGDLREQL